MEKSHDMAAERADAVGRGLTCQEPLELVTNSQDGTLPARQRVRFDAHLAVCHPGVCCVEQIGLMVCALLGGLDEQDEHARTG